MTTSPVSKPVQLVYTPAEVAAVLRVTPETIRRKIVSGELGAIEVGGKERKQYRITGHDLGEWLGIERTKELFGIAGGVASLEKRLAEVPEDEFEAAIEEAVRAVRASSPKPQGQFLPTPTPEEIAERFKR